MTGSRNNFIEATNLEVAVTRDFVKSLPDFYHKFLTVMMKYSNQYAAFLIYTNESNFQRNQNQERLDAWLQEIKRAKIFINFKLAWRHQLFKLAQNNTIPETAIKEIDHGYFLDAPAKSNCIWTQFAAACKNYSELQYEKDKAEIRACLKQYRSSAKMFSKKQQEQMQPVKTRNWLNAAGALVLTGVIAAALLVTFWYINVATLAVVLALAAAMAVSWGVAAYCLKGDRIGQQVEVKTVPVVKDFSTVAKVSETLGFSPAQASSKVNEDRSCVGSHLSTVESVVQLSIVNAAPTTSPRLK